MTQIYLNERSVEWMRAGLCPECGEMPFKHSSDIRFWVRQGCDLLPYGVANRIAKQREIDERAAAS